MCALGGGTSQQHLLRMEGVWVDVWARNSSARQQVVGEGTGQPTLGCPNHHCCMSVYQRLRRPEGKIGRLQGLREPQHTAAPVGAAGSSVSKAPCGAGHTGCSNRKVAVGGFAFQAWVAAVAAAGVGGAL